MRTLFNKLLAIRLSGVRSRIRFGDYEKAISLANRHSKSLPENPIARMLLADAHLFFGEIETAIQHYKAVESILEDDDISDRRYLRAYLNHRLFEVDFFLGKHNCIVKKELIKKINGLASQKHTRVLFRLEPNAMEVPRPFANRNEL